MLAKLVITLSHISMNANVPLIKRIRGFALGFITKNVVKGGNDKNKNP